MTVGKGKRPRDPVQLAKQVFDIAIGEAEDTVSESKRNPSKRRSGGLKGGTARAKSLSTAKRKAIARKAANVLVSADRQQEPLDSRYPYSIFRDHYPSSDTPWRYCNSGGYIGKRTDVIKMLRRMQSIDWGSCRRFVPVYRQGDWENDQFRMSLAYLCGWPLDVDTHCDLFQTMGCTQPGEMVWQDGRLHNSITHTKPSVVHFNGLMPGMEDAFKTCFGAVYAN